ncbi:glycoside hydrolase family 20 protein [sediment metagenome]|uniref:Glycoside hydrolase family 20 protein n=1 Tax=sediment metagenome TaxID=749907 RepID=D9PHG8_9ZZZZ
MLTFTGGIKTLLVTELLPSPFQIIPQPQKTELLRGKGIEYGGLNCLVLEGGMSRPVMGEILSLLTESGKSKGTLTLKLDNSAEVPGSVEGYVLTISNGDAKIISKGEAGLFYGCQTLEQLLEDARDFNTPIPACKITDSPALSCRAVHFDVKHHLDHINYYYESINRLARYKINAIIFEFEDKLRYQRQPLVGAPQAVSIDEMAALTQYARERHIEISPLIQGLGHATFILKHQEYQHLRELPDNRWAFCPLHEGTYQVLFDLYRDAMDATPGSPYLHIGGDEIGNIGLCPRCKPTADKEGMLILNLYWLKRVCEFAEENGRIPIFWDDMILKEAGVYETTYNEKISREKADKVWETGEVKLEEAISDFPKNCIYMRWNYTMARQPGNIMALDWYQKHGLKVMVATAVQSGPAALFPFDQRVENVSSQGTIAIKSFVELATEKGTEGMLCTAWDDRSPHMETYWRGFIASAEFSWSPGKRTLEEFDFAYLQKEYGVSMPKYADLYSRLRDAAVFWEKAFLKKGSRMDRENALFTMPGLEHWLLPENPDESVKIDFSKVLIELPDLQNQGQWSVTYAQRLAEADAISREYQYTSKTLKDLHNHSNRNRYHWELFSAINDFQVTAPHLLIALEQCDTADKVSLESGLANVKAALSEFDQAWVKLKETYGKTRFIASPENYVPDRYFHFASQREDLTWMIQVEELFHKNIIQWIANAK